MSVHRFWQQNGPPRLRRLRVNRTRAPRCRATKTAVGEKSTSTLIFLIQEWRSSHVDDDFFFARASQSIKSSTRLPTSRVLPLTLGAYAV